MGDTCHMHFGIRTLCLLGVMNVAVHALCQAPVVPPLGRRVPYKAVNGRILSLYINEPSGTSITPRAAIIFFNGGGWIGGGPRQFNPQSEAVAEHGAVGIEVEYRFIRKADKTAEPRVCVEDAKSAIRWVRSHATEMNLDPSRIAAAGGSAGGYMAAYTAMVPGWDSPTDPKKISPKPNALVLFNPVLDNGPNGYGSERFGSDYRQRSPLFFVSTNTPPTIIMSGENDAFMQMFYVIFKCA